MNLKELKESVNGKYKSNDKFVSSINIGDTFDNSYVGKVEVLDINYNSFAQECFIKVKAENRNSEKMSLTQFITQLKKDGYNLG